MSKLYSSLLSRSPSRADIALKAYQQEKYVRQLWIFLASVVALLALYNWGYYLCVQLTKPRPFHTEDKDISNRNSEKRSPDTSISGDTKAPSLRRLPITLTSFFRVLLFRTTVPIGPSSVMTVSELLFILGYNTALLIWLFVDTRDMDTFFFEDRAAHIASSQVPLIVALAGKNNLISVLTGVSHEKLNVLHRASGRTCLVFLWLHALTRGISGLSESFSLQNGWMRWGVAGLTAFSLTAVLSIRPIRNKFYEFFLVTHILLICIFIIGGLIHAGSKGFGDYFWPALIIWGLDRLLRVFKLLWNNHTWSRRSSDKQFARVELLTFDTVRLTIRSRMHWKAGQHAYISLPSIGRLPSESHPFTIASIPRLLDGSEIEEEKNAVFLIRVQGNFTTRLRDYALRNDVSSSIPAFIDGPYGIPPNLRAYSTCLLFAGGSGISYTLPLLQDLVYHSRRESSNCKRIIFVWVVRDAAHLPWVSKLLLEIIPSASYDLSIEPRIFITGKEFKSSYSINSHNYNMSGSNSNYPFSEESLGTSDNLAITSIQTSYGRPDVEQLIEDSVSTSSGPVLVDVAGPSSLASAVRSAVSFEGMRLKEIMKGYPVVTFHSEAFGLVKA